MPTKAALHPAAARVCPSRKAPNDQPLNGSPGSDAVSPEPKNDQPLHLRSSHLRRDIKSQLANPSGVSGSVTDDGVESYAETVGCVTLSREPSAAGDLFPAYYDGIPAVLALGPPSNGTR